MGELPNWSIYCSVQVAPKAAFAQTGCVVDDPICTACPISAEDLGLTNIGHRVCSDIITQALLLTA